MPIPTADTAIACAAGGFKAVFAHGVLSAFAESGARPGAIAGGSASALPAALAAAGAAKTVGLDLWREGLAILGRAGHGMNDVAFAGVVDARPTLRTLFSADATRLCIAASAVVTVQAATETQGKGAPTLGRRLLIHAARNDRSWVDQHLAPHLWDSEAREQTHRLHAANLEDVLFASARMLHEGESSAEVDGIPYVAAAYTCACPALEMAALGFREVVAVATDPGPLYRDIFKTAVIPEMSWRARIRIIRPEISPKERGVAEDTATEQGLRALYEHGIARGRAFLTSR